MEALHSCDVPLCISASVPSDVVLVYRPGQYLISG